jgi:hypothetical protein
MWAVDVDVICASQEAGFYLHGLQQLPLGCDLVLSALCDVLCVVLLDCRSLSTMQLLTKYLG